MTDEQADELLRDNPWAKWSDARELLQTAAAMGADSVKNVVKPARCVDCKSWGSGDGTGVPYDAGHVNFCNHKQVSGEQHPSFGACGEPKTMVYLPVGQPQQVMTRRVRAFCSTRCITKALNRCTIIFRVLSSVGRASPLRGECRRFETVRTHR